VLVVAVFVQVAATSSVRTVVLATKLNVAASTGPCDDGPKGADAMSALEQVVGGRAQRLIARAGITAWSTIGLVGVTAIVLLMLSAISSVVLPLIFAAVLAVLFRPVAAWLETRGMRPTLAAGAVVIGCVVAVARGRGARRAGRPRPDRTDRRAGRSGPDHVGSRRGDGR
jgi:hypothetical protein